MNVITMTSHILCEECVAKFDRKEPVPMAPNFTAKVFQRSSILTNPGFAQVFAEAYSKVMTSGVAICCHVAVSLEMAFPPTEVVQP